ncbi:MAG TPA: suppressor of fused domain protein [Tepidisphaeraceae bacterium]|nr:suppressor of fused domain protein [Tepidisphaeraceae bacterium]
MMEYDQGRQPGPPLRTEILLDARKRACDVANVAATIAFFIMKDGWEVAPGVTFARIVEMYAPDLRVKHILFVAPFQWDRGMTRVELGDRTIYPLLAVPITEGELGLVKAHGSLELERGWERSSTDVLDWSRNGLA